MVPMYHSSEAYRKHRGEAPHILDFRIMANLFLEQEQPVHIICEVYQTSNWVYTLWQRKIPAHNSNLGRPARGYTDWDIPTNYSTTYTSKKKERKGHVSIPCFVKNLTYTTHYNSNVVLLELCDKDNIRGREEREWKEEREKRRETKKPLLNQISYIIWFSVHIPKHCKIIYYCNMCYMGYLQMKPRAHKPDKQ